MEKSRQVCAVPREGWERGGMLSGLRAGDPQRFPGCSANNPSLHGMQSAREGAQRGASSSPSCGGR